MTRLLFFVCKILLYVESDVKFYTCTLLFNSNIVIINCDIVLIDANFICVKNTQWYVVLICNHNQHSRAVL